MCIIDNAAAAAATAGWGERVSRGGHITSASCSSSTHANMTSYDCCLSHGFIMAAAVRTSSFAADRWTLPDDGRVAL